MDAIGGNLNSFLFFQVWIEVLSSPLLWTFLGDFIATDPSNYFVSLANFICRIIKSCKGHDALVASALSQILTSSVFEEFDPTTDVNSNLKHRKTANSTLDVVSELIRLVLKIAPKLFPALQPIVESIIDNSKMSTDEKQFVKDVVNQLSFAGSLSPENSSGSWKMLPTIPNEKELLGTLMEADQSLPQVKVNEPYLNGKFQI